MSAVSIAELVVLIVLLAISTPLLGGYMAKVFGSARLDRADAERARTHSRGNRRPGPRGPGRGRRRRDGHPGADAGPAPHR